jgi:hypothetical protein
MVHKNKKVSSQEQRFEKEINIGIHIVPYPFEVYTRVKLDSYYNNNNKKFEFGVFEIMYFKMTPNK